MFTQANTAGFTQDELDLMNHALATLIERGMEEKDASDRINNNWRETGNTIESLTR